MSVRVDIDLNMAVWTRRRLQPKDLLVSCAKAHTKPLSSAPCAIKWPRVHFSNAQRALRFDVGDDVGRFVED